MASETAGSEAGLAIGSGVSTGVGSAVAAATLAATGDPRNSGMPAGQSPGQPVGQAVGKYDVYIERQIRRTRRQVKIVDLTSTLLGLAAGSMTYLLLVVVCDHWVFSGGLGFGGRLALLVLWLIGAIAFAWWRLWPLVAWRISPIYAADQIERHRPSLKNSLINFLLLRSRAESLPRSIYEAIERQAATGLAAVPGETAVDRSAVIRIGWVLLAIMAIFSLYKIISPKDPFTSVKRVMAPWSDLLPPTRVSINLVQPGDTEAFHDERLAVSAEVHGLSSGEEVALLYSTADGQVIDRPVPMARPDGGYRFAAELPPESAGLEQDLTYYIAAGDARTGRFQVLVRTAPAIQVKAVAYQFPAYTEIAPRRIERRGDIEGIDGTLVTIHAQANHEIKQAWLDFDCDGRRDLAMQASGRDASVTFPLTLEKGSDRPEHESYQLRFRNPAGHENPKPIRYSIAVARDMPPRVAIVDPVLDSNKDYQLIEGAGLRLKLEASDPDFKLGAVTLHAVRGLQVLCDDSLIPEPQAGPFARQFIFDSKRFDLAAGESVSLWVEAADNRQPEPNRTQTPRYTIRIVSPDGEQKRPDQLAQADSRKKPNDRQQPSDKQEKGQQPDDHRQPGDSDESGQSGEPTQSSEPGENDPQSKEGENSKQDPSETGDSEQSPAGDQAADQSTDQASEPGEKGSDQGGEKNPSGTGESQTGESQTGESQTAENQTGESQSSQPRSAQQSPSEGESFANNQNQGSNSNPESSPAAPEANRVDPDTNPGEAFERVLKHREEQAQDSKDPTQPDAKSENQPDHQPEAQARENDAGQKQPGAKSEQQPDAQARDENPKQEQPGAKSEQQPDPQSSDDSNQQGEKQPGSEADPKQTSDTPDAKGGAGQSDANRSDADPNRQEPKDQQTGQADGPGSKPGERPEPKSATGDSPADAQQTGDDEPKDHEGNAQPKPGEGGQAKGAGKRDENQKREGKRQPGKPQGGDAEPTDKGDGGAGTPGGNPKGSPAPQDANQAREKKQESPDGGRPDSTDEAESPSGSPKQSDSQGGVGGDRSGGGKKGGGQRSDSPGTGSAGQNTASDQGSGHADQKGEGERGDAGGDQETADQPTGGASAETKGPGSKSRPGKDQTGGEPQPRPRSEPVPGEQEPGESTDSAESPGGDEPQPGDAPKGGEGDSSNAGPGKSGGNPIAGGQPGEDDDSKLNPDKAAEPGADAANLEYARKATDLALEYLKDQLEKDQPDQKLLDKLQWTREDMERFVRRWEQLKQSAREDKKGKDERARFDETLRSLGLRPRGTSLSGGRTRNDRGGRLRESRRVAPPSEFADQFREFSKATARGRPLKESPANDNP